MKSGLKNVLKVKIFLIICLINRHSLSFLQLTLQKIFLLFSLFSSFHKLCLTMVFLLQFTKLLLYRKKIATSDNDAVAKVVVER